MYKITHDLLEQIIWELENPANNSKEAERRDNLALLLREEYNIKSEENGMEIIEE